MQSKLSDIIRIGTVSSINPKNCTAQVTFDDRQQTVSGDLFVLVPSTGSIKAYSMPAIGERVLCLYTPDSPSEGCILGSYYSTTRSPPITNENKLHLNFGGGDFIEVGAGTVDVSFQGKKINISKQGINIVSNGTVNITAPIINLN